MAEYKEYIKALRQCAKEHKNDITPTFQIRVSDLCEDTAKLLENDVIERSKIDDTIFEIKEGYYGDEEMSETDSERADAFNNGLSYALEILKRNIGE